MYFIIYFLFTLSGFIALIYESTWSHYLKLLLGHSSYGQILTLCIFIGGLGLGAFIAGKFVKRLKNPLYSYAILELFIGIGGFLYHDTYIIVSNFYYYLISSFAISPFFAGLLKITLLTLITSPIAIVIGMTFPFLCVGLMRLEQDRGKSTLSRLYFTNSLGAAIGIMVTSFIFIPNLGTVGSLIIAGTGNILLAVSFFILSKKVKSKIANDTFEKGADLLYGDQKLANNFILIIWLTIAFLTGLSSFIYEIGWLRIISMLIGSTTHSFDIMGSTFILGLAIGGYFAKRLLYKYKNIPTTLAYVQVLLGSFAMFSIYISNYLFELVSKVSDILPRTESTYYIYILFKYIVCLILVLPASLFAGMTLPIITYYLNNFTKNEQFTGSVYGWNTIGAIVGAALAGLLILPLFQLKFTIATGAIIDIILGLALLFVYQVNRSRILVAVVFSLFVIIPVFFQNLDKSLLVSGVFRQNMQFNDEDEIIVKDGKTATVSIVKKNNGILLRSNGRGEAAVSKSNEPYHAEYHQAAPAFIAMSLFNNTYNAAMIGMGSGMTAHYLLGDPLLRQLDVYEIEEQFYHLSKHFLPYNHRAYNDNRISFIFDDARTYIQSTKKKYDLILSQPSVLWVSGVQSLFTEQFYGQVKEILKPNGALVQWLQLFEIDSNTLFIVLKTINHVFPDSKIYINSGTKSIIIVASNGKNIKINDKPFEYIDSIKNDINRFSNQTNYFTNSTYIISTNSLKLLLDNYQSNSDYYPKIESESEKNMFLEKTTNLGMLINSLFYYQEILEPELFSEHLKQRLNKQSSYKLNENKLNYLNNLINNSNSDVNWKLINKLFHELVPFSMLRGKWNELETVDLILQHKTFLDKYVKNNEELNKEEKILLNYLGMQLKNN